MAKRKIKFAKTNTSLSSGWKDDYCRHHEETIHDFLLVGKHNYTSIVKMSVGDTCRTYRVCASYYVENWGTRRGRVFMLGVLFLTLLWPWLEYLNSCYVRNGEDWVVKWACGCSGGDWIWATWVHCIGVYEKMCRNKMFDKTSVSKPIFWPPTHASGQRDSY